MRQVHWVAAALIATASLGCSNSDPIDYTLGGGDADDGGDDDGGAGGDNAGGAGGGSTGPEVCPDASGVYPVEAAPSNLLFLLDRSGSMHLRVGEDGTRWTLTTAGLADILTSVSDDTMAGLAMFPSGDAPVTCCSVTPGNFIDCECAAGELPTPEARCEAETYDALAVPFAKLDAGHEADLMAAVTASDEEFYWGTPLAPALAGTIDAAAALSLPGVTSVVLLSDGLPTSCDSTADPTANDVARALDAAALGSSSGIRTYVVGIDGEAASSDPATDLAINLSQLAAAAGTARFAGCEATNDCAYLVNVDNFEQALAEALTSIALEAASCTFDLPMPGGGLPDYDAVNITVTSEGQTHQISKDTSHSDGWDYTPSSTQVVLYGSACELMKNDAGAKVEVIVGCTTIEN